jgi:hypothetical protein
MLTRACPPAALLGHGVGKTEALRRTWPPHPRGAQAGAVTATLRLTRSGNGRRLERRKSTTLRYFFSLARMALIRFLSAGSVLMDRALP